jgi:hypothetical protein
MVRPEGITFCIHDPVTLADIAEMPARVLGPGTKGTVRRGGDGDLIFVDADDITRPAVTTAMVGGEIRYARGRI